MKPPLALKEPPVSAPAATCLFASVPGVEFIVINLATVPAPTRPSHEEGDL